MKKTMVVFGVAAILSLLAATMIWGGEDHPRKGQFVSENETVIREFLKAWSRLDPKELASYFTDDGIYHNMPLQPVQGREKIQGFIGGFISSWTKTDWEVVNIVAAGDLVIAERVDRTKAGDKSVDLPCVGVFELENGKIKVFRDYFDLGTYIKAMS